MLRLQHPIIASRRIASNAYRVSATYTQFSTLTYGQSRYIHQTARGSGLINARSPRRIIPIKKGAKQNMTAPIKQYSTTTASTEPAVHDVFDTTSGTWQYVVADPSTSTAVIIDPVLNFDPATQTITTKSADALLGLVKDKNYKIDKILETHAHADHLSAASYLQNRLLQNQDHKPPICIGKRIEQVQKLFSQRYGVPKSEYKQVFDRLLDDDETFTIGNITAQAIHLPGHTPDHLGYMIGDNVFCGDSLFHADIGTARCDFPGGDAKDLFQSGRKLLSLPGHVKIWTGHDYPPAGREPMPWLSVQDHRELNKHLKDGVNEDMFVALRQERDAGLAAPRLLHQSLQINIRAGRLPAPTEAGQRLLHVPLKIEDAW
ncbi:unnamed protein product [Penicillium salamii]|nr:unnamed protein product [Penicillium salamii]